MEQKIKKIVKQKFSANPVNIKRITEGYSHYMYDVELNKFPGEVIIRFSNNTKKTNNLRKEKYVIDLLAKNQVPVPKIYAFDDSDDGYMVLEKIKAIRLDLIWDKLTKQEKIQVTKEIGKLMNKMHKIKFSDFGYIEEYGGIDSDTSFKFRKMGEKPRHSLFLRRFLRYHFEDFARLISYKHMSPDFVSKFMHYISKNLHQVEYTGEPVFMHGDFMTGHLFVEKQDSEYKIVGLIDFEFAEASCPYYDFIKLHRQGFFEDHDLKNALIKSYGYINEQALEIFRLTRDLGFAWAVLESGNKELSDQKISELYEKIKEKLKEN